MRTIKLGRKKDYRNNLLINLAVSLILYEEIRTTISKAKAVKPLIEKLIGRAQKNDLSSRRYLLSRLHYHRLAVKKLIENLGPRFSGRKTGFVRVVKLGLRPGDSAPMVKLELVQKIEESETSKQKNPQIKNGKQNQQKASS